MNVRGILIFLPLFRKEMYQVMLLLIKLGYVNESYTYKYVAENKAFKVEESSKNLTSEILEEDSFYDSDRQASRRSSISKTASRKASETTDGERNMSENTSTTHKKKKGGTTAPEDTEKPNLDKLKAHITEICQFKKPELEKLLNIKARAEEFKNFSNNTSGINIVLRDTINDFWHSVIQQKCPFCPKKQDVIKKEGYSKLFIMKKSEE
jgi:hypothetical protein